MFDITSPYYIDFPGRIRAIQAEMAKEKIDLYLGSRLRTMSWTTDAFFPWRSFIVIPAEGLPTAFTFVIDAARAARIWWTKTCSQLSTAAMWPVPRSMCFVPSRCPRAIRWKSCQMCC